LLLLTHADIRFTSVVDQLINNRSFDLCVYRQKKPDHVRMIDLQ